MERAVRTTSQLGFMLRNLEHELCSRFTDELLLKDKYAMTLGSPHVSSRASLGACIGEGNLHFYKYSIFGHIYLLLQIIIEDIKQMIGSQNERHISDRVETILCRPAIYTHYQCFPKEISATRLALAAKNCCKKIKTIINGEVFFTS